MFVIICIKDGDKNTTIPIVQGDDDTMATWDTLEEAMAFSVGNILCQASNVIIINLDTHPTI